MKLRVEQSSAIVLRAGDLKRTEKKEEENTLHVYRRGLPEELGAAENNFLEIFSSGARAYRCNLALFWPSYFIFMYNSPLDFL